MLTFDECKVIAERHAQEYGTKIEKAYKIGNGFAFDTPEQFTGVFPFVVDAETETSSGLWEYLVKNNLSMDDMQECETA